MIKSFADGQAEKVWKGEFSSKFTNEIQHIARRKLRMINNAQNINDLRITPSNRLKKLKRDLKGSYSVRINKQWRIIFQWKENNVERVKIEDCHD